MEDRSRRMTLATRVSRAFVAVVVVAGVALLVQRAAAAHGAGPEGLPEVQAAIDRANEAYLDALERSDARGYAALFAADAVSMPARGTMVRGRDAIQASIAEAFKHIAFLDGMIRTTETHVDGSTAYEIGRYSFDVSSGGVASTLAGRYVVVWRKIGGEWKIAVDASQPNAPV